MNTPTQNPHDSSFNVIQSLESGLFFSFLYRCFAVTLTAAGCLLVIYANWVIAAGLFLIFLAAVFGKMGEIRSN